MTRTRTNMILGMLIQFAKRLGSGLPWEKLSSVENKKIKQREQEAEEACSQRVKKNVKIIRKEKIKQRNQDAG